VSVVVKVPHRLNLRPLENLTQHPLKLHKLRSQFAEYHLVVVPQCGAGASHGRSRLDAPRKIEDETLPSQFPILHGLPIPGKPLVPGTPRPDVCRQLGLIVVAEQFGSIVRVTKPLHLETQILVETAEYECNLILERIQMLGRRCTQFRWLDQEAFRHITALA
jgi:hypothetical protein